MTRLISSPPNELNRFSVGTKNKDLVYGADGVADALCAT